MEIGTWRRLPQSDLEMLWMDDGVHPAFLFDEVSWWDKAKARKQRKEKPRYVTIIFFPTESQGGKENHKVTAFVWLSWDMGCHTAARLPLRETRVSPGCVPVEAEATYVVG